MRFILFAICGGLLFATVTPGQATVSCKTYGEKIRNARADVETVAVLYRQAERERVCSAVQREQLGRMVAYAYYRRAFAVGISHDDRSLLLRAGLKYGRPWRLLAVEADIAKQNKDYARAAALYAEALDDINDRAANPKAPPVELIAQLYKKAETTRLLAPYYAPARKRGSEVPGGLAVTQFRGFTSNRTAVPVHFKYDDVAFTPEGEKAVVDMLDYLVAQKSPDITLIGHTDERGADAYNQRLSQRRAEAVRRRLIASGYKGQIRTLGKGEAEPFQSDDPGSYTQEEHWQLDRRVELQRSGEKP